MFADAFCVWMKDVRAFESFSNPLIFFPFRSHSLMLCTEILGVASEMAQNNSAILFFIFILWMCVLTQNFFFRMCYCCDDRAALHTRKKCVGSFFSFPLLCTFKYAVPATEEWKKTVEPSIKFFYVCECAWYMHTRVCSRNVNLKKKSYYTQSLSSV